MELFIKPDGTIRCLYDETLDLATLGSRTIQRASHVEPDEQGRWWADLAPSSGPRLGPFPLRSEALRAEQVWLEQRLCSGHLPPFPSSA